MPKYRFKTEAEFRADDNWRGGYPNGWVSDMMPNIGKPIPDEYNHFIEQGVPFRINDSCGNWLYNHQNRHCVLLQAEVKTNSNFIIHPVKEFKM